MVAPMGERCCHVPSRVGCALSATEVQSSWRDLNLVYTPVNEHIFLIPTLRPICRMGQVRLPDEAVRRPPERKAGHPVVSNGTIEIRSW